MLSSLPSLTGVVSLLSRTAIRLYSEIVTKQPEIEHQTGSSLLAHIIRECGKSKRLADALRFFEAARARPTFTPDVIVLSSLINACGLAGDVDKAMQIFQGARPHALAYHERPTFSRIPMWWALVWHGNRHEERLQSDAEYSDLWHYLSMACPEQ
jgi:pentatricopeptide repeat protein